MNTDKRIRAFAKGSQYADWLMHNCEVCRKGIENVGAPGDWPLCEIEAALTEAYVRDGTVSEAIALRMGHGLGGYSWECGEFEEGPPPPTPDGRIKVAEAWQMDGFIFNPWMLFEEKVAVAHGGPLQLRASLGKKPGDVMRQATSETAPAFPEAIFDFPGAIAYNSAILFRSPSLPDLAINTSWWCQFYEAGFDIARSVSLPEAFVVQRGGDAFGVVQGLGLDAGMYKAIWTAAGGAK